MNYRISILKISTILFKIIGILVFLPILFFLFIFILLKIDDNRTDGFEIKENTVLYSYMDNEGLGITDGFKSDTLEGTPDIQTFMIINDSYAKDKNHVWFHKHTIDGADLKTFTIFLNHGGYSKDKNHVYHHDQPILKADPDTYEWLADGYTKDQNHVYYEDKVVELAKPSSFQCWDNGIGYAKDIEHIFYQGILIDDADVKTFSIKDSITYEDDGSITTHTDKPIIKDAHNNYHKGIKTNF